MHIKSEVQQLLFTQHLGNSFHFYHQPVDTGCQHLDSLEINAKETFKNFEAFQKSYISEKEKLWLRSNQIDLVISDVSSMPVKAAQKIGIPSILIGNFTWHDIYSHLNGAESQQNLLQELREEYYSADLQILPQCHSLPSLAKKTKEVGFIAQKGQSIRKKLEEHLNISFAEKNLVFIYLGDYGKNSVFWQNLSKHRDCHFITRDPLEQTISGLHVLDDRFLYSDLIASADLVCTKGGYSTIGSAFASHKPVITCERKDFYEFVAIREYLQRTRTGIIIDDEDFYTGNWQAAIKTALNITVKDKVPLNGEIEILESVHQILS